MAPGHTLTLDFLTKAHSEQEIRDGVRTLKARGQKVVMSINGRDDWEGHEYGWENLDPPLFAANVKKIVIDDWGLDGIDLDNEADYTPEAKPDGNFVQVIQELRKALGPDALITLPVYMGQERDLYLNFVMKEVTAIYTMAYWNKLDGQKSLLSFVVAKAETTSCSPFSTLLLFCPEGLKALIDPLASIPTIVFGEIV